MNTASQLSPTKNVRLDIWDETETLPRPEIEQLQVERLRACVARLAERVPFYREKLAEADVTGETIQALLDGEFDDFLTSMGLTEDEIEVLADLLENKLNVAAHVTALSADERKYRLHDSKCERHGQCEMAEFRDHRGFNLAVAAFSSALATSGGM